MTNNYPQKTASSLCIGDIFTPLTWADFAIQQFNLYQKWLNGASIFDPTMGEGNLLEGLIVHGIQQGKSISELPTNNLFGNELNTKYYTNALSKFQEQYGLDMSGNFTNEDILNLPRKQYSIIFGNPPWQNFVDLPDSYKEQIKSYFIQYDLVGKAQNLLLGGSRIDISALIIQIAIKDFLLQNGEAVFFMPLSLLLNDGANRNFRTYSIGSVNFSIESVYDFNDEDVFGGIATRYGLTHFIRDKKIEFPLPYFRMNSVEWSEYYAKPMFHETDPLSILTKQYSIETDAIHPLTISSESSPRQGVNTCGANDIFFFDKYKELDNNLVEVSNKKKIGVILPKQFVFPLITSSCFNAESIEPNKWVLLPYSNNGKPLDKKLVESYPTLANYLEENRMLLEGRKGVMLNAMIKRGYWWAMLGVGAYNFLPHKIVWEAYGRSTFRPRLFEGHWQANQSLQAFIPTRSLEEAERVVAFLKDKKVEDYLLSLKMEGTMNWAQPGKIKKLLLFKEEGYKLF